jgi:hypothetical protein
VGFGVTAIFEIEGAGGLENLSIRRAVSAALLRGALEVARDAKGRAPQAFGHLAQSITVSRANDVEYHVVAGQRYASAVEAGVAPGRWIPRTALRDWVRTKLHPAPEQVNAVAEAIRVNIARRGIKPQPFMQPALDANQGRILALVRQAVQL